MRVEQAEVEKFYWLVAMSYRWCEMNQWREDSFQKWLYLDIRLGVVGRDVILLIRAFILLPVAFIWLNWLSFLMLARGGVFARLTIYTSCITLWSFHNDVRWSSDMWPTKQLPYFSLGYVTTIFSYQVPGRISRPRNMLLKFSTSFPLL